MWATQRVVPDRAQEGPLAQVNAPFVTQCAVARIGEGVSNGIAC
jgi:hypothetical protein